MRIEPLYNLKTRLILTIQQIESDALQKVCENAKKKIINTIPQEIGNNDYKF